jgi:hypothetical protein
VAGDAMAEARSPRDLAPEGGAPSCRTRHVVRAAAPRIRGFGAKNPRLLRFRGYLGYPTLAWA